MDKLCQKHSTHPTGSPSWFGYWRSSVSSASHTLLMMDSSVMHDVFIRTNKLKRWGHLELLLRWHEVHPMHWSAIAALHYQHYHRVHVRANLPPVPVDQCMMPAQWQWSWCDWNNLLSRLETSHLCSGHYLGCPEHVHVGGTLELEVQKQHWVSLSL